MRSTDSAEDPKFAYVVWHLILEEDDYPVRYWSDMASALAQLASEGWLLLGPFPRRYRRGWGTAKIRELWETAAYLSWLLADREIFSGALKLMGTLERSSRRGL